MYFFYLGVNRPFKHSGFRIQTSTKLHYFFVKFCVLCCTKSPFFSLNGGGPAVEMLSNVILIITAAPFPLCPIQARHKQLSKTPPPSFKGAAAGWWQAGRRRRGLVARLTAEVKVCVCVCGTVCVCVSAISNSACHSNRSKGHGPPQLCVHKLHHLPLHWSIVAGLFVQSRGFGWRPIRYVSVRYSFLAWTHCSQQPTVSESRLWRPDVLSHEWRGPPAELLQLLHILIVARLAGVVKLGPGSRPPLLWSTQPGSAAEAVLPAPLSQLPHTQGGQSQTDSPPLPPEPPSHFPL